MALEVDSSLRLLLDERNIERLLQRYCHAMDHGPTSAWVDCFTDDGVFDVRDANREPMFRVAGREELARFIEAYPDDLPPHYKHVYLSPIIDVSGDVAKVESYVFVIWCHAAEPAEVASFGKVEDVLVRTSGAWRIRERVAVTEAMPSDRTQHISWPEHS